MNVKKFLEKFVRYTLIVLLMLNLMNSLLISFVKPECHFFGIKLGKVNAQIYLLTGGITGMVILYFLFRGELEGDMLSVFYFEYFFVESLITNSSLGLGFKIAPLANLGLVVSLVLIVLRKMIYR